MMRRFPFSEVTRANDVSAGSILFSLRAVEVGADLELRIYSPTCEAGQASVAFRGQRVRVVRVSKANLKDVGLLGAEFQGQIIKLSDVVEALGKS